MKNYYYITGSSKGIGKAFAERVLKEENSVVIGLSRSKSISHANYLHKAIDLSDSKQVNSFVFEKHPDAASITLVNNAGAIGEIMPVGAQTNENIEKVFWINTIAPAILINKFIACYGKTLTVKRAILNISSGAAKNPISSWSAYCASKAAIDMYSKVVNEEQAPHGIRILAIAPGVVDTNMQGEIRAAKKENFPRLDDFINYHTSNQLLSTDLVSEKLFRILFKIEDIPETIISLRDY